MNTEFFERDAKKVFETMLSVLDELKWKYESDDNKFSIKLGARGEDLPMPIFVNVPTDRQALVIRSILPFQIPQEKKMIILQAVVAANKSMLIGSFDYDISEGLMEYKLVVPFLESLISKALCHFGLMLTCHMTDRFNDKFLDLVNGNINLNDFNEFLSE